MDFVDRGDDRPEPISIARCRELLGDEADTLTDQDIEMICRHADVRGARMRAVADIEPGRLASRGDGRRTARRHLPKAH